MTGTLRNELIVFSYYLEGAVKTVTKHINMYINIDVHVFQESWSGKVQRGFIERYCMCLRK